MGILQAIGLAPRANLLNQQAISSPWAEGSLQTIVWADILGEDVTLPLTRAEAMTVPAVARARNLIVSTASRYPLIALDKAGPLVDEKQPGWMFRTDGTLSPHLRTVWTLDDMIFYGAALWEVTRGSDGQILTAERVPWEWWEVTSEGAIKIKGQPVNARDVIYFPSHTDALLTAAAVTIRTARDVALAVAKRAKNPVPVMEIHQENTDVELSGDEAKEYVKAYNAARRDPEGATVFTPAHISLNPHGDKADAGALVEARNACRLDVANHTGVPAAMLEGSSAGASLTYVTTEGKRSEALEYGVQPWIDTFTSRLSQDDVLPRGQRARLDQADMYTPTPSATGAEMQD